MSVHAVVLEEKTNPEPKQEKKEVKVVNLPGRIYLLNKRNDEDCQGTSDTNQWDRIPFGGGLLF